MGEGLNFSTLSRHAARKKNDLAAWEPSPKQDGNYGICERAVASLPSFHLAKVTTVRAKRYSTEAYNRKVCERI